MMRPIFQLLRQAALAVALLAPLGAATPGEDLDHLAALIAANDVRAGMDWVYGPDFVATLSGPEMIDTMWAETRRTMAAPLAHRADLRFAEGKPYRFKNNPLGFTCVPVTIAGVEMMQFIGAPK